MFSFWIYFRWHSLLCMLEFSVLADHSDSICSEIAGGTHQQSTKRSQSGDQVIWVTEILRIITPVALEMILETV